jgi:hypothetical protein
VTFGVTPDRRVKCEVFNNSTVESTGTIGFPGSPVDDAALVDGHLWR